MPAYLPTELLIELFRLAALPAFTSDGNRERRRTLTALCFVSHHFRAIAEPMLAKAVFLDGRTKGIELSSLAVEVEGGTRGERVRHLVLSQLYGSVVERRNVTVEAALGLCPHVETLDIYNCTPFDLSSLSGLKNLRRLSIRRTPLLLTCPPSPLVNLTDLSLTDYCSFEDLSDCTHPWFRASYLPSLRSFTLSDPDSFSSCGGSSSPLFLLDAPLSAQLDAFTTNMRLFDVPHLSLSSLPPPARIQLRVHIKFLPRILPPRAPFSPIHIALEEDGVPGTRGRWSHAQKAQWMRQLVDVVRSVSSIRTLEMPATFRQGRTLDAAGEAIIEEMSRVVQEKGVKVLWRKQEEEEGEEPTFRGAFWRRVKEERTRE
ncbi:hypothetical protein JCM6882_001824 [Rhodosporidiobolus microsporus]